MTIASTIRTSHDDPELAIREAKDKCIRVEYPKGITRYIFDDNSALDVTRVIFLNCGSWTE
tara:strand:+ start:5160 stop:5342 length:183 start_codon:yes stop_codon:yes gene_type:complete